MWVKKLPRQARIFGLQKAVWTGSSHAQREVYGLWTGRTYGCPTIGYGGLDSLQAVGELNRSNHFSRAISHLLQSRVPTPPPPMPSTRPHLHLIVAWPLTLAGALSKSIVVPCRSRICIDLHRTPTPMLPYYVTHVMYRSNLMLLQQWVSMSFRSIKCL